MRKVVFICYFFAPQNDAGSFRSIQFANRLPERGYEPVIFTTTESSIVEKGGSIDHTLLHDIPTELKIFRIPDRNLTFKRWSRFRLYRIPWTFNYKNNIDLCSDWSKISVRKAIDYINSENIEIVYVSCAPISSAFEALKIVRSTNAKLVIDFRDPFTDAYGHEFPGKWGWKKARKIEGKIIKGADHIIVNTQQAKEVMCNRYADYSSKIEVITNGY